MLNLSASMGLSTLPSGRDSVTFLSHMKKRFIFYLTNPVVCVMIRHNERETSGTGRPC